MIFYAFGYHRDHGYFGGAGAHNGDSEFLVFELLPPTVRNKAWLLTRAYLSAHRGKNPGDSSVLVNGGSLQTGWEGRPLIWVAKNKHANYVSQSACGVGAGHLDDCDNNTLTTWFMVRDYGNLGQINNRTYPSPPACAVPSRAISTSNKECYWSYGRFYGWQGPGDGSATGYQDILYDFGFNGERAHING